MMLDGAEECQLSGPIGELVPYRRLERFGHSQGASSTNAVAPQHRARPSI
jgi:hypothetical protein